MGYLIFLRLIHIVCAVFWAGSMIYLAAFVMPAVKALGPDGGKFMQQLSRTNKLPIVTLIAGTLTVMGGTLLIWHFSGGFQVQWFGTPHGIVFSFGGTLAIIAYVIGVSVNFPAILRMGAIGKMLASSGSPPSSAQLEELQKLRKKLFLATNIIAWLLLICSIAMSIARYF